MIHTLLRAFVFNNKLESTCLENLQIPQMLSHIWNSHILIVEEAYINAKMLES